MMHNRWLSQIQDARVHTYGVTSPGTKGKKEYSAISIEHFSNPVKFCFSLIPERVLVEMVQPN